MVTYEMLVSNPHVSSVLGSAGKDMGGEVSVSTDSRNITPDQVFIALDGPNHKGAYFVESCLQRGVKLVVVNDSEENRRNIDSLISSGHKFSTIFSSNTLLYFQELARMYSLKWQENGGIVVAISGSNGKTTVKEMLHHLLPAVYPGRVSATEKNFNNHIGVPLTILSIPWDHKVAVIEMGTDHSGELETLCKIASPTCGLLTNIGESHLKSFGNRKGVFEEKSALYDAVRSVGGTYIVNEDDDYLRTLSRWDRAVSYGREGRDIKVDIAPDGLVLTTKTGKVGIKNDKINESFNYFNLGLAVSLVISLFPGREDDIAVSAASFIPPQNNRTTWLEVDGKNVFLDAYNANPSSMIESIKAFIDRVGDIESSLFILGDMKDLGETTEVAHRRVGKLLKERGAKNVVCVGESCPFYEEGLGRSVKHYGKVEELSRDWGKYLDSYDTFFIKGSRTLQLESLLDTVKK